MGLVYGQEYEPNSVEHVLFKHRQPLCTNQVLLEYQLLWKSIDVIQVSMQ